MVRFEIPDPNKPHLLALRVTKILEPIKVNPRFSPRYGPYLLPVKEGEFIAIGYRASSKHPSQVRVFDTNTTNYSALRHLSLWN